MPPPIPTDPVGIRWFIMHDVLLEKTVLEGFEDFCKIYPQYNYLEYEFYYEHFSAGSLDLNVVYHQRADPEPRRLDELPSEVLEMILEPLDVKNRFNVRQVNKRMLSVVDRLKINYDMIHIGCYGYSVNVIVWFEDSSSTTKSWTPSGESAREKFKEFSRHLKSIFKPTMIRMKRFRIHSQNVDHVKPIVELLVSIADSENSKFHAESTEIRIQEQNIGLLFLSLLKPKTLEVLNIGRWSGNVNGYDDYNMDQIKNMNQFKKAKIVELWGTIQSTDLELFSKFKDFCVSVQSMKAEDVIRLREDLSKPDNSLFKKCCILTSIRNVAEIRKALGEDIPDEETFNVKHICPIVNTEESLHFSISSGWYGRVIVEKVDPIELAAKYQRPVYEEYSDDDSEWSDDDSEWSDEDSELSEYELNGYGFWRRVERR